MGSNFGNHIGGLAAGLIVGLQRHRTDSLGAMATLAVLLEDGQDIAVESWRLMR